MTIAFIHSGKSFLPELDAYADFFSKYAVKTLVALPSEAGGLRADVEWHFMGNRKGFSRIAPVCIHEYASASVPPWRRLKDFLKSRMQPIPDYRLFLNEYVRRCLDFRDRVPFGFRDMGIQPIAAGHDPQHITYDFVYAGSLHPNRRMEKLLDHFTRGGMEKHQLLLLGRDGSRLKEKYASRSNFHFEGPVAHREVAAYLSRSRFAINFIPDREPFNQQTSAKFLEYAGSGLPVISSDYPWVRDFQMQYGGKYFFLARDLSNFTWEKVTQHAYEKPDLSEWSWEKQIRRSGVLEFLRSRFSGLAW